MSRHRFVQCVLPILSVVFLVGAGPVVQAPATEGQNRVHAFFINGCDPLGVGDLSGVCDQVRGLGFVHAQYGQMYNTHGFGQEIRRLRASEPTARIAVVGYSLGARCACSMVHDLQRDGVTVDLLIYVGPAAMGTSAWTRPENARQIVNITGFTPKSASVPAGDRAESHHLGTGHFSVPTHPETVQTIINALNSLAAATPTPVVNAKK